MRISSIGDLPATVSACYLSFGGFAPDGSGARGAALEDVLHSVHVWDRHNTLAPRTRMSVLGLRRVG